MRNLVISQQVKAVGFRGKGILSSLFKSGRGLGLVVLLGACSKHNDPPPATTPTNGFCWTADNTTYTSSSATVTNDGFLMTISGVTTTSIGQNIIRLGVPLAAGTYTAPTTSYPAYYYMSYLVYTGGTGVAYLASNAGGTAMGTVTG